MENFTFLHEDYVQTTTSLTVTSGTNTVANLIDRNSDSRWITSGYAAGTSVTITYTVPGAANTTVSRFFFRNTNFGQFRVFYDGVTANVFTPNISAASNTASHTYFEVAAQTVSSITLQIDTTYPLNEEKACGEFYVGGVYVDFPRNPSHDNFNPILYRKGFDLEMADGGMVGIYIDQKYRAELELGFVSETNRDLFRACYDAHKPFYFIPYPINGFTTTSQWNGEASEVIWTGDFDFLRFSSNVYGNGYAGFISVAETPDR